MQHEAEQAVHGDIGDRLHFLLIQSIIETGHAPDLKVLAAAAGAAEDEVEQGLEALRQRHGVILEPGSLRVWSVHPFALNPTAFWVQANRGGWWANCGWCALGIGAALGQDATIVTREGADGSELTLRVASGRGHPDGVVLHFPQPPSRWWDNPFAPCANILFFSSAEQIDGWCSRHGRPRGAVLDLATAVRLAEAWFGDYGSATWRRKTPEQASEIFRGLGLDPVFWSLGEDFR